MLLSQWLAMLTRRLKDMADLTPWKCALQIPCLISLMPCVVIQYIIGTWVARTIETSVITWHKAQDSTLNVYRRPNIKLQLIRCLCLAVSLYSALQAVVLRLKNDYKSRSNPYTFLCRPCWFQEFKAPRFQDSQNIKVVSLSDLHTGHLYPTRNYSWYSFQLEAQ